MAVAVPVLLSVGYYGSLMGIAFGAAAGWIDRSAPLVIAYVAPWRVCCEYGFPGYDDAVYGVRWAGAMGLEFRLAHERE